MKNCHWFFNEVMNTCKNWFEVSKEGLKELQLGKPKEFIARELIQNAWDEDIKECQFNSTWKDNCATISVEDDSPIGFRDITHAFTLFAPTYKRKDAEKRGRFNIGEKQVLSLCEEAQIKTTKGTVIFDENGRTETSSKRKKGSIIEIKVKMAIKEYAEMLDSIRNYLVPKDIKFSVNEFKVKYREADKTIQTALLTEIEKDGFFRKAFRKTSIHVLSNSNGQTYLYEMGIPITTIDCKYNIDIQQKVPLNIDRETIPPTYLKEVYAEVLNEMYNEIDEVDASELWVREAMSSKRSIKESKRHVIEQRFGKKVCVANPFDKNSIDEAISRGYQVVYGSHFSKEEWSGLKEDGIIQSSSELFGSSYGNADLVEELTKEQQTFEKYAKKVAKQLLKIELKVIFIKMKNGVAATYGDCCLTLNLSSLGNEFFKEPISARTTDLLLHELGHEDGRHIEKSYHELITEMAGKLVMLALNEPTFFDIK